MKKRLKKNTVRKHTPMLNPARQTLTTTKAAKRLSTKQVKLLLDLCYENQVLLKRVQYRVALIKLIIKGPK